ncbi:hypothetical protein SNEBB_004697, partial [Seison nebaliae]
MESKSSKHRYVSGIVIFRRDGSKKEYLLYQKKGKSDNWSPPKGRKDDDDKNALATAYREIKEETGLKKKHIYLLPNPPVIYCYEKDDEIVHVTFYFGELKEDKKLDVSHEHEQYTWAKFDEAKNLIITFLIVTTNCKYEPTWESLDSHPIPQWYDEGKIGIFIHWGLYSVPSFKTEWFWRDWKSNSTVFVQFMRENYKPDFTYADFAPEFTASFFNASEWVDIFKSAGAKYIVMGSKHHEGFTMWPSKYKFNWNS